MESSKKITNVVTTATQRLAMTAMTAMLVMTRLLTVLVVLRMITAMLAISTIDIVTITMKLLTLNEIAMVTVVL